MAARPDHPTLLDAVGEWLLSEVSPRLEGDKAAQFRVLIAANLVSTVAGELRTATERTEAELARLRALLGGGHEVEAMNAELEARLKAGTLAPEAAVAHLMSAIGERLKVLNPRFELDP